MNDRIYDPVLGLFLRPDPFFQAPNYPNNYNRYTYALNNPLKYVDPSGYQTYLSPGYMAYSNEGSGDSFDPRDNCWAESWNSPQRFGGGGGGSVYDHGSFGGGNFTLAQVDKHSNPFIYHADYFDRETGKWIRYDDKARQYYYNESTPYWGSDFVKVEASMKEYVKYVRDFGVQSSRVYIDASNDGDTSVRDSEIL